MLTVACTRENTDRRNRIINAQAGTAPYNSQKDTIKIAVYYKMMWLKDTTCKRDEDETPIILLTNILVS